MSAEVEITGANFESETGKGITLVDFWAPWCAPCRMQGPVVEKVAEKMAGKAKVGKCNVDQEPGLAQRFGISSIPTLVVFRDGREVDRLIGLQNEKALVNKMNSLITASK